MAQTKRILYSFPLSGHSHRAELALSLMGLDFENRVMDLRAGEQKSDWFLKLHPEGKVPVLVDGDDVIYESTAILTYLAAKYDVANTWIPASAYEQSLVQRYFAQASGPLAAGPARARLIQLFGANFDEEETITNAHAYLAGLEANLQGRDYLLGEAITFADVALYSYVARAPEGFVSLDAYPNIRGWLARIEAQDGFVEIPETGVPAAA